jgi:hypothetical protein
MVSLHHNTSAEFDKPLASTLSASLVYCHPSRAVIAMLPNGTPGLRPKSFRISVCIRKASHTVEEIKPLHQKKASSGAGLRRMDVFGLPGSRFGDSRAAAAAAASPPYSNQPSGEDTWRLTSEPSSSDTNSPFDQPTSRSMGGLLSNDLSNAEGSQDAWVELKMNDIHDTLGGSLVS